MILLGAVVVGVSDEGWVSVVGGVDASVDAVDVDIPDVVGGTVVAGILDVAGGNDVAALLGLSVAMQPDRRTATIKIIAPTCNSFFMRITVLFPF